jgi:hypothetical protein
MTQATESVLADALRLDARARAELAANLLAGLDSPADPDAASAWDLEIQRRVDALEAGTEKLESWETVKGRIASDKRYNGGGRIRCQTKLAVKFSQLPAELIKKRSWNGN